MLSGVSSVSLPANSFSATYDNYFLQINFTTSGNANVGYRLRAAGVDASGTDYAFQTIKARNTTIDGAAETLSLLRFSPDGVIGSHCAKSFIYKPFLAEPTFFQNEYANSIIGAGLTGGRHTLSTSYDSLSILPSTGNISGVYYLYGMND
jgi:hypothetical protein